MWQNINLSKVLFVAFISPPNTALSNHVENISEKNKVKKCNGAGNEIFTFIHLGKNNKKIRKST